MPANRERERVDTAPKISDEVKETTCYMCACRCGVRVHLRDGHIRYLEGNPRHPVNRGVLCAKGSAGIMQHNSPARLRKPLRRVGPRGEGRFEEIEWEDAIALAVDWLGAIRRSDPKKLAFFTGRDQSQALTGWWASQFGTPNHAAHGGFCSVNMAAAGIYTIGGSFWEFGEPDWEHTRLLLMFGVAEDHDSNPIKIGLSKLKANGAKFVSVNPVRTGYSAIADEWIGIRPGTDGLFVLALVHELLRAGSVDAEFLIRYTNAPWLVIRDEGGPEDGLIARDEDGAPLCWDLRSEELSSALAPEISPALAGSYRLPDGRSGTPAFELLVRRYQQPEFAPDAVAGTTGVPAATIRRIAAEVAGAAFEETVTIEQPWTDWAGRRHERMTGRPVAMHAMRGISAHSNGFHTCRAIHLLQMLLGTVDVPGGFRYKPPFPKPAPPALKPAGKPGEIAPGAPMPGPPLGFPSGPADLLVNEDGSPVRIDKAFSWEAPLAAHGMLHMVPANGWRGDPYPIDTLFIYMANMSWNSAMNTAETMHMLTDRDDTGSYRIPHIICADAYASEMVAYSDLVLPDTTYLERWDCISLLDRPISSADGAADAIRHPVVRPDRDVRPFQDVLIDIGARLGLPGLVRDDGSPRYPGGYPDYLVNHQRAPGIGSLAGWRGVDGTLEGTGEPNPEQLERYVEAGSFWQQPLAPEMRFFKHANRDYLNHAVAMGWIGSPDQIILQLYSEPMQRFRLAARGHGQALPPAELRERIDRYFDPLPIWYQPFHEAATDGDAYPLHALTQRPMAMYHSWGSMNAWLRQIHPSNRLYIGRRRADSLGIEDDSWVDIVSPHGRIRARVKLMEGVNEDTVWTWNAIGKRAGAWGLSDDAPESREGFLLNHLIPERLPPQPNGHRHANADPVTGQAAWYDLRVRLEPATDGATASAPRFDPLPRPPGLAAPSSVLRFGAGFRPRRPDSAAR